MARRVRTVSARPARRWSPAPSRARRSCSWARLEDPDVLVDRAVLEPLEGGEHGVDVSLPVRTWPSGPATAVEVLELLGAGCLAALRDSSVMATPYSPALTPAG